MLETIKCECSAPGCPYCQGDCGRTAAMLLHLVHMDDQTGTLFCTLCGDDAFATGLFRMGEED